MIKVLLVTFRTLWKRFKKRDERDANRKHSPLSQPKNALIIDTTNLTINEVVTKVMALVKA